MPAKIITLQKKNYRGHLSKFCEYEIPLGKLLWIADPQGFLNATHPTHTESVFIPKSKLGEFRSVGEIIKFMNQKKVVISCYTPFELLSTQSRKIGRRVCFADVEQKIHKAFQVVHSIGGQDVPNTIPAPKNSNLSTLVEDIIINLQTGTPLAYKPASTLESIHNVHQVFQQLVCHPEMTLSRLEAVINSVKQIPDYKTLLGCGVVELEDALRIGFTERGTKIKSVDNIHERLLDMCYPGVYC